MNVGRKYSRWPENNYKRMNVTVPVPLYSLKTYRRRRGLAPLIPNFGTRQK